MCSVLWKEPAGEAWGGPSGIELSVELDLRLCAVAPPLPRFPHLSVRVTVSCLLRKILGFSNIVIELLRKLSP